MQLQIMSSRIENLQAAYDGLLKTGIPLVSVWDGTLSAAATSDDIGMFLIVPWLARVLKVDVVTAASIFLLSVLGISAIVGFAGLWKLSSNPKARIYAALVVTGLAYVAYRVGDVYVVSCALPLAVLPWALVFATRDKSPRSWLAFVTLAGFASGIAHVIRSHSATPAIIAVLVLLLLSTRLSAARRWLLSIILLLALIAAVFVMRYPVYIRDAYLSQQIEGYVHSPDRHPFWHSVYIGLGYVPNEAVPEYRDEVAIAKVAELSPSAEYLSPSYERTLKEEYFRLLRTEPGLVLRVTLAKLGWILVQLAVALNIGLLGLVLHRARPPLSYMLALGLAIAFASLNGLLVAPYFKYMTGMYASAAVTACLIVSLYFDEHLRESVRHQVRPDNEPIL